MKFTESIHGWLKEPNYKVSLHDVYHSARNVIRCNGCNKFLAWDKIILTWYKGNSKQFLDDAKCYHCKANLFI
jgi:hypothetical protein